MGSCVRGMGVLESINTYPANNYYRFRFFFVFNCSCGVLTKYYRASILIRCVTTIGATKILCSCSNISFNFYANKLYFTPKLFDSDAAFYIRRTTKP